MSLSNYNFVLIYAFFYLRDKSRSGARLILPGGREGVTHLVVASKSVDSALDKDETELAVLVLAVLLKVLADGHSLLDEVVEVLGDGGSKTVDLEDAEDLGASDILDLADAVGVTEDDADLSGGHALASKLADVLRDVLGGHLEPGGSGTLVGEGRSGDTLARIVHATHFFKEMYSCVCWLAVV